MKAVSQHRREFDSSVTNQFCPSFSYFFFTQTRGSSLCYLNATQNPQRVCDLLLSLQVAAVGMTKVWEPGLRLIGMERRLQM